MFEIPASELLYPPNEPVLPVEIIRFYNELLVEKGSALTVLGIILVLIVYGFGQLLMYGLRRIKKYNSQRVVQDVLSDIEMSSELKMSVPNSAIQMDIERQVT
jgi:iron(III) transport system permease protein